MSEQDTKIAYAKRLIKIGFFAILSVAILGFGVYADQVSKTDGVSLVTDLQFEEKTLNVPGNAYIVSESANIDKFLNVKLVGDSYLANMSEGRIFANFGSSFSRFNIAIGGKIVIIPSFSDFDLSYNKDMVTLNSFIGNTYVGFLPNGSKEEKYMNEYSPEFANVLLVPAGMRAVISLKKIDSRVENLLFFKLVKEFGYSAIPERLYDEDTFVKENLTKSLKFEEDLKTLKRDQFASDVPTGVSSALTDFLKKNLTVFQEKEDQYYLSKIDKDMYKAATAFSDLDMKNYLTDFTTVYNSIPKRVFDGISYKNFVIRWLSNLVVFDGFDREYQVLGAVTDVASGFFDKNFLLAVNLSRFNTYLYQGKNIERIYEIFYTGVEKLFKFTDDAKVYKSFLENYNQIFDNMLLLNPGLYKIDYFKMKSSVEKELYSLYYGGQLKEELKQSFVKRKIDFLKRLKKYFFEEKVDLKDATGIMSQLVQDVEGYMPAKTSQAAVIELFERELSDIGNFWGYINDVEYSKSTLYGETHKERYEVYLKEKDQVLSILDVQRDILGSDIVPDVTTYDIMMSVKAALEKIPATDVKVESVTNVKQRFIKVSASVDGYIFDAEYDRDYGTLRNIYAYGELVTDGIVKISGVRDLLKKNVGAEVSGVDTSTVSGETNAQKIAKSIIAKKLIEKGFEVSISQVEIIDSVQASYRVNKLSIGSKGSDEGFVISFDYYANTETVKNLFVMRGGTGINVSGEFPIDSLKDIVLNGQY